LAEALGADKGGASPGEEWQVKLAKLFGCHRDDLFRHPDEAWFSEFFRRLITVTRRAMVSESDSHRCWH